MNEIIQNIKRRRSTRAFSPKQITDEELKAILEAGIFAPSAMNKQDWFFTILQNAQMIDKLTGWIIDEARYVKNEKAQEIAATPNAAIFRRAPTVIVISGDGSEPHSKDDCACAAQNIMLACESIGLGSCLISYVAFLGNRDKLASYREELKIPEGYVPHFGLTIGYKSGPDADPYPRRRGVTKIFR
jgi:nitroreductase